MTPIDIGVSGSQSSGAQSGTASTGSFSVSGSGNKSSITTSIVLGAVALVGLVLWLKLR